MITLALYCNDDGDPRVAIVEHHEDQSADILASMLSQYTGGSAVFLVPWRTDAEVPEIMDEYGQEVQRQYVSAV